MHAFWKNYPCTLDQLSRLNIASLYRVDLAIIITSLILLFLEINPKYYMLLFFRPVKLIRCVHTLVKGLLKLWFKCAANPIFLLSGCFGRRKGTGMLSRNYYS